MAWWWWREVVDRVGMRGGWGWTLCNGFNLHKSSWTSSGENTRDPLALPPPCQLQHPPSPVPAAWATAIQRSLLPAPPTRSITMFLLTGAVADRAGQFYERCKNSGERSKKTRKLKGSQANQLRARYAAQSTSQGPASLGDYGHKHGVGTNHTPAAKSQVNQTHPTTNHHLALPPF